MAKVNFTSALKRFFPNLESIEVKASNVKELLDQLEHHYPGMKSYVLDDAGRLRKHVNIFIGEDLIEDEENLNDAIFDSSQVHIFQALSGG
jgi:molybdopterin converting factor small subunit